MSDSVKYQTCAKTVLDESYPGITFDADGICNHYWDFQKVVKSNWRPDATGRKVLERRVEEIKKAGDDLDALLKDLQAQYEAGKKAKDDIIATISPKMAMLRSVQRAAAKASAKDEL